MAFKCVEDADLWRWSVDGSKEFHAGLASLKLEYSVVQNPGIFDILLSLDPEQVKNQGKKALEEEACWIDSMLAASYTLQLGGTKGASSGWGRCLAVEIDTDMSHHRSRLGNELAAKSAKDGLMSCPAAPCLAVEIDTDMSHHRSRLGNELAAKSAKDGLMKLIQTCRTIGVDLGMSLQRSLQRMA
eukprot:gene14187-20156_t